MLSGIIFYGLAVYRYLTLALKTDEKLRIIIALRSADRKLPAAHAYADDIKWQSFFSSYNRIELFLHIFSPYLKQKKLQYMNMITTHFIIAVSQYVVKQKNKLR